MEKIEWIEIDNLPKNVVPSIKIELDNIKREIYYSKEDNHSKGYLFV